MKLLTLALAAATIAAPANAQVPLAEINEAHEAAKVVCPIADRGSETGQEMLAIINKEARERYLTAYERMLVTGLCVLYMRGKHDGLQEAMRLAR